MDDSSAAVLAGRPIGVFDSGVGGLTVAAALMRRMPRERIVYLGDTARLPYGTKSAETVRRYTEANLEFLIGRGVKAVVVACNTASALALPGLHTPLPTWGVVEPGAAAAAKVARRRVGVIGTESTVRSGAYERALKRLSPELEVRSLACPLFVPLVEEGWTEGQIAELVARRYLQPLLEDAETEAIDTLVLGCTHYPLLRPVLGRVLGERVQLVDSAEAAAELVARELREAGLASKGGPEIATEHKIYATDASPPFARLASELLGESVSLEWVDV